MYMYSYMSDNNNSVKSILKSVNIQKNYGYLKGLWVNTLEFQKSNA